MMHKVMQVLLSFFQKMATPERSVHIGDRKLNQRIQSLKQELELRNVQIADLQQEIVDADQGKPLANL